MSNYEKMFPNIAGYKEIKQEANQIVDVVLNMEKYVQRGARCPRGWLFYGDPGMGKTQIVKDIADCLQYPIVEISSSDAVGRGYSLEEEIVKGFEYAKKQDKAIILLDEMDKFAGYQTFDYEIEENVRNSTILLRELDLVVPDGKVIIIATVNKMSLLPQSLLRGGRFDRQIKFDYPNKEDRECIIKKYLSKSSLEEGLEISELVKLTCGESCANIECIVNEAIIQSVSERQEKVCLKDFMYAFKRVSLQDISKEGPNDESQLKYVAYHEAGHAVVANALFPHKLSSISIINQGCSAGMVSLLREDCVVITRKQYENMAMVGLAGTIATELMLGEQVGGNRTDLNKCHNLIATMLDEGFYGYEYLKPTSTRGFDPGVRISGTTIDLRAQKIGEIMSMLGERTEEILKTNMALIDAIAIKLIEKKELSNSDFENIAKGISNASAL